MIALDRPAPADAWMLIGWGTPAAILGLISGLVIAAFSKTSGSMFSILHRLFELIGRLVVAALLVSGTGMVLERFGIPFDVTACAGVGVYLFVPFIRPMMEKRRRGDQSCGNGWKVRCDQRDTKLPGDDNAHKCGILEET
jgi:hypothetical protein